MQLNKVKNKLIKYIMKTTIHTIRKKREENTSLLFETVKLFFAFSDKQLIEGLKKHGIGEGVKLVNTGSGGYLPNENLEVFKKGMAKIKEKYKKDMKPYKLELIKYELNNHECNFSGDITPVIDVLEGIVTSKEIEEVFRTGKLIK